MARAAHGINLEELYDFTGVDKGTVNKYEKGVTKKLWGSTRERLETFFEGALVFLPAQEGVCGVGVQFKPGAKPGGFRLEPASPPPLPVPQSSGAAALLAYWRSRPAEWLSLPREVQDLQLEAVYGFVPEMDPIVTADGVLPAAE